MDRLRLGAEDRYDNAGEKQQPATATAKPSTCRNTRHPSKRQSESMERWNPQPFRETIPKIEKEDSDQVGQPPHQSHPLPHSPPLEGKHRIPQDEGPRLRL